MEQQAQGAAKRRSLSLQMVDGDGMGTGKLTPVGPIVVCRLPEGQFHVLLHGFSSYTYPWIKCKCHNPALTELRMCVSVPLLLWDVVRCGS